MNVFNKRVLSISFDDKEMVLSSKWFLNEVEKDFNNFKIEYLKMENKFSKYRYLRNFGFDSEKILKKSPLTLINAPWGTGKTHFIENLLMLLNDKKIESAVFKKIIVIDAWKFSNSQNIAIEFIVELAKKMAWFYYDGKRKWNFEWLERRYIKKLLKILVPTSVQWGISFFVNFSFTHNLKDVNKNINEKKWELIYKNKIPTLIFIDNLERLGASSWELLKIILKMQEFENYLFILPMNLNRLKSNEAKINSEYPIEKYIDFDYFDFEQDYKNFFSNYFIDADAVKSLDKIFSSEIAGSKLSIREIEKIFKSKNLFNEVEHITLLKKVKLIWNSESAYEWIAKEMISEFVSYEKRLLEVYIMTCEEIEKDNGGIYQKHQFEFLSLFVQLFNKKFYQYNTNTDYSKNYQLELNNIRWAKNLEKDNSPSKIEYNKMEEKIFHNYALWNKIFSENNYKNIYHRVLKNAIVSIIPDFDYLFFVNKGQIPGVKDINFAKKIADIIFS